MSAAPTAPAVPQADDAGHWNAFLNRFPSSPAFDRAASFAVDEQLPATALRLLEPGLARYPLHATGWLLAAKSYIMLRRYTDARRALERVLALAPSSIVAQLLAREMRELELRFPPAGRSFAEAPPAAVTAEPDRGGAGADRSGGPGADPSGAPRGGRKRKRWSWEAGLIGDAPREAAAHAAPGVPPAGTLPTGTPPTGTPPTGVPPAGVLPAGTPPAARGFDLESLAQKLETARMPFGGEAGGEADADGIVGEADLHARPATETLAAIYVRQGKLQEAIDAYRELRALHPERTYEYTVRIIELEQQRRAGGPIDAGGGTRP